MQDGAGAEAAGSSMQALLALLADGEEQARQLGEMMADDPWSRAEHYRGAARRLQCTLGKAAAVARAIEAAAPGSSRGTDDRSDSPRSADESSGRTTTEVQERQSMFKRRCVAFTFFFKLKRKNAAYQYVPRAKMRCQTSAMEKFWRVHAWVKWQKKKKKKKKPKQPLSNLKKKKKKKKKKKNLKKKKK